MIAKATDFEKIMKANGAGSFGKVEYADEMGVLLRTGSMKTADLSGTVRVYFDGKREQVMTGRRFDPMGSGLLLMRAGSFYKVYSTLEIVKPIPEGVTAMVVLLPDIADLMVVTTAPFRAGFTGAINFNVQPFRRMEVEEMVCLGKLVFFRDTVNLDEEWLERLREEVLASVPKEVKTGNSDRTKPSAKTGNKSSKVISKDEAPVTNPEAVSK